MAIFRARSSRFCVFSKDFIGLTVSRTRLVGNFGELPKVFSSDMRLKSSESILFLIVVFWKWWSWIVWMLFYILYGDRWHVSGIRYWRQSVICAWSHPFRKKRSSNKTAGSDLRQMTCQVSSNCLLSISVICRLTRYKTI